MASKCFCDGCGVELDSGRVEGGGADRTSITISRSSADGGAYVQFDACSKCTPALIAKLEERMHEDLARNQQAVAARRARAAQGELS